MMMRQIPQTDRPDLPPVEVTIGAALHLRWSTWDETHTYAGAPAVCIAGCAVDDCSWTACTPCERPDEPAHRARARQVIRDAISAHALEEHDADRVNIVMTATGRGWNDGA